MNRLSVLALCLLIASGCTQDRPQPDDGSVRIVRDEYGVAHVYAVSVYGLYYGYGYAIAQDRMFQMEMAKRSTQGTVAEVLGAAYLDFDKGTRALFSPASIRTQLSNLADEDRKVFDGYAAGINAWLAEIRKVPDTLMPKQFLDNGFEPADWTGYDVAMIFIGTMNNRYGDFNTELENAAILAALTERHGERAGQALFELMNPRFTEDSPTTIPREDWSRPVQDTLAAVPDIHDPVVRLAANPSPPSPFSNVWVLGKDKVDGANAVLINGPQFGWFNPSYVYSIGLHGPGIDVVGNTPFGYPMIMFGHNATITWGSTWGASDLVDVYAEQLNPDDPDQYLHDGEYLELEHRVEHIAVRDGEPVEHDVYRSVHGPVIHIDREAGVAYAKRRSWEGGELDNLLAWLRATWATDWASWKAQAQQATINVNMYYADVEGNVGYFHGGWYPLRASGHDNRFPVSGDGGMEWQGRQSIDAANPHVLNPSSGMVVNWNNKPGHGVLNPDFFFYSWSSAHRIDYLHETLGRQDRFTPDEAWDVLEQSSYADLTAKYLLPIIDRAVADTDNADARVANETLQAWDRHSRDADGDGFYDERGTALFRAFVSLLAERVLSDDLGETYPYFASTGYPTADAPTGAGTSIGIGVKAIIEALEGNADFDVFNSVAPETVVVEALADAAAATGDSLLAVARRPFGTRNFLGIPQAGDEEMLTGRIEQNRGTENNMIVMRPGAIEGWEVTPPGQNAFIGPAGQRGPHYDDQFDLYQQFGRKRMWFYPEDVEANKQSEIHLSY